MNSEHKWGYPPIGAGIDESVWWGARAIYERHDARRAAPIPIDLVWDRQQCTGGTDAERAALEAWINGFGLPALRKAVSKAQLQPNETRQVEVRDERAGYIMVADPRRSHGYLYIGAARLVRP